MSREPVISRWTPVPDKGALDLLKAKRYTALAVWLCMLRDATLHQTWETSRSIAELQAETSLSRQTIVNARNYLAKHGYISRSDGGGGSRRKTTFAVTPVPRYGGIPAAPADGTAVPVKRETGNWKL